MFNSHWVFWNWFFINWNIFRMMCSWSWLSCFVTGNESTSQHRILWQVTLVRILVNHIVPYLWVILRRIYMFLLSWPRCSCKIWIKWSKSSSWSHTISVRCLFAWILWSNKWWKTIRVRRWKWITPTILSSTTHRVLRGVSLT